MIIEIIITLLVMAVALLVGILCVAGNAQDRLERNAEQDRLEKINLRARLDYAEKNLAKFASDRVKQAAKNKKKKPDVIFVE